MLQAGVVLRKCIFRRQYCCSRAECKYPKSGYVIGGDRNKLQLQPLLDALPKCRQIVNTCTYKAKILDIMLTNLGSFFSPVYIAAPVQCDDPTKGVPSDPNTVVA